MRLLSHIIAFRQETEKTLNNLPDLIVNAEQASHNLLHGLHNRKKSGTGESFWQFREYNNTDRPQDIDWRQSAKSDAVLIKQKELQTAQKTILWCNQSASMNFRSRNKYYTKHDVAKTLCLALSLMLTKTGEHVGLLQMDKTGNSTKHIHKIASLLFSGSAKAPLPDMTTHTLPKNASFIGVSDFLSPPDTIKEKLNALSSRTKNGMIIQVLDPAEVTFPYHGRIDFMGTDNIKTSVNNASDMRDAYQKKISAHIKNIEQICAQAQWHYVLHKTDTDIRDTLKHIIALTAEAR